MMQRATTAVWQQNMCTGAYLHMWEGENPAYKDTIYDLYSALPEGTAALQVHYTALQIH